METIKMTEIAVKALDRKKASDLSVIRIDDINKPKSIVIVDSFDVTEPEHMYEVINWIYNFELVKSFNLDSKWLQVCKWKSNNLLFEAGLDVRNTKNVNIKEVIIKQLSFIIFFIVIYITFS